MIIYILFSVSDDNSSVQSSPWQRDHCWKQATPRRGLSRELCLLYLRPSCLSSHLLRCPAARLKRRRPLDPTPVPPLPSQPTNGSPSLPASASPNPADHPFRGTDKPTAQGKFKFFRNKSDNAMEPVALRVYKKTAKKAKRREMSVIIDSLKERLPQFTPVNAKISALNCKQEHSMVSPRKRILRELERVSLEDQANKRSRARHTPPAPAPQPGPSCAPDPPKLYNGSSHSHSQSRPHPPPKPVSSYSIHSILSMSEDSAPSGSPDGHSKKPHSYSSVKTESPVSAHSPDSLSVKKPHAYACAKLDSPVSVHSPDPSPSPEHYRRAAGVWGRSPPPVRPYMPPRAPDLADYYYGEGYSLYPGAYLAPGPYLGSYPGYVPARAPPVWLQYPPQLPPGPWAPLLSDHAPRDDTSG